MSAGGTRPARPFQQRRTATAADIDELGHVNNAVYVRWIQDIATAHWHAVAPPSAQEDHIWVVVRHEIDYRKPTLPGEEILLSTWVGSPQGARFDRFVEITGPDGDVRVAARTWWALLDRQTMRPLRVRDDLVAPFRS